MLVVIQKHQRNWPVLVAVQRVAAAAAAGVVCWMPQTLAGLVDLAAVTLVIQMGQMNSEQEPLADCQMHWIPQSHQAVAGIQTDLGKHIIKNYLLAYIDTFSLNLSNSSFVICVRLRLHGHSLKWTQFHDLQTASKTTLCEPANFLLDHFNLMQFRCLHDQWNCVVLKTF